MKKYFLPLVAFLIAGVMSQAMAGGNELSYLKIQELPTLPGSAVDPTADFMPIFDASAGKVFKLLRGDLINTNLTIAVDTTLSNSLHAGKILILNSAVSTTMTLPPATGSGRAYTFVVGAVNTSNYVVTRAGSDVMRGSLIYASDNAANAALAFEAAGAASMTLNGTTRGGASIGDTFTLRDCVSGVWCLSGQVTETGTEVTPFS